MSGTIILGYDIESCSPSTIGFLEGATLLHDRLEVAWTIYLTGQTVEMHAEKMMGMVRNPRLTIGQHTYSHMLLKSVYMQPGDGRPVHGAYPNYFNKGGELPVIREEIEKTQRLLRERLGVECRGLTGPWGYYRGLADRPDILRILQDNSIRWIRANARDYRDCQPTPFTEQPFFYTDQGFPDILELGIQGYQDDFYWERFGDRHTDRTYDDFIRGALQKVAENDWVWNVCSHDHVTPTPKAFFENKGRWLESLILRAKELGIRFIAPGQLYDELKRKQPAAQANPLPARSG